MLVNNSGTNITPLETGTNPIGLTDHPWTPTGTLTTINGIVYGQGGTYQLDVNIALNAGQTISSCKVAMVAYGPVSSTSPYTRTTFTIPGVNGTALVDQNCTTSYVLAAPLVDPETGSSHFTLTVTATANASNGNHVQARCDVDAIFTVVISGTTYTNTASRAVNLSY